MGHINGYSAPLDQRIAAMLVSDVVNKGELTVLLAEAEQALAEAQETIKTETVNALDIANVDPDTSDELVRKAERTCARLIKAIPKLRDRIKSIELFEYREAWHTEADTVQARSALSAERLKHYEKFIVWLQAEFKEVDAINAEISTLHARAPYGEDRRLIEPELLARGLDHFDAIHPPLRENLKLPKWDRSSEIAFPPNPMDEWNAQAAEMNQALTKRMAEKYALVTGDNWAAGRDLAVHQAEAEFAKKDAERQAKEVADKALYEQRVQEDDKRRRGVLGVAK